MFKDPVLATVTNTRNNKSIVHMNWTSEHALFHTIWHVPRIKIVLLIAFHRSLDCVSSFPDCVPYTPIACIDSVTGLSAPDSNCVINEKEPKTSSHSTNPTVSEVCSLMTLYIRC